MAGQGAAACWKRPCVLGRGASILRAWVKVVRPRAVLEWRGYLWTGGRLAVGAGWILVPRTVASLGCPPEVLFCT